MEEASVCGKVTIYGGKASNTTCLFVLVMILLVYVLKRLRGGDVFAERQQRDEAENTDRVRPSLLDQGYKNTSVSQIVDEAGVARGSYLNLFPTKDKILLDLTETMFGGQFGMARSIADIKLPPVYAYAVETVIQLTLTELNENLREIYIEAYSLPETSEYIYLHTTAELKQIFSANFPDYSDSDFYEMEIGTAGLMRNYMARKCDIHFPLERKLSRFLTAAMRVYRVPEDELAKVLAFIQSLDIKAIATKVMYKLFAMLEMKYDFRLSKDGETEVTR